MKELIAANFGKLFEPKILEEIEKIGILKSVAKDEILIETGAYMKHMPLLISGAIKILRVDEEGGELLLYFLQKGDTCAMTMTCCLGETVSEIRAVAEVDTELILIPISKVEEWLQYKTWRDFVFESYNSRMYEMLDSIDSLAFMNMYERLFKYLRNKAIVSKSKMLEISHQDIADEMNTSRVVISRLLKQYEKEGKINLHRNRLEIVEL